MRTRALIRLIAAIACLTLAAGAAYTVRSGDNLTAIAAQHGVSLSDLATANGIDNPDLIVIGQILQIPGEDSSSAADAPSGPTSASSAGATSGGTHVVVPGESLALIAARNGLSVAELAAANGITDPNRLLAGALLRIAGAPAPAPGLATTQGGTHVVTSGETLSSIAQSLGVSIADILGLNELDDPNRIYVGQELAVPGSGGVAWACPIPGGTFINDFGVAKPDGRHHEGVDVFAPHGTVILAPVSGVVRHVEGNRAGLQFTLEGDDGYTYIGAHLDSFGAAGRVAQGEPLGQVGDTGNARGAPAHLHLEMHQDGVVNPYPTLSAYC